MTIEEFCKEYRITKYQFIGKEFIPGNFGPKDLVELPDGDIYARFSPRIVLGNLDLRYLTKLPNGFNPIMEYGYICLSTEIICGDIICTEDVKKSLRLMLSSTDKEIRNLAVSGLWKYRTEDIMEITKEIMILDHPLQHPLYPRISKVKFV